MRKDTSISIGLHVGKQIIDLQIPIKVSVNRLKELLKESLELANIFLPDSFELEIINKSIQLKEEVILANYALGDGDQLLVKETMGK
ncbi:type VII secretion protein, YukD family [Carnobacterium divergens]|uniref:Type VII secretion protein, YukD family n=1 Tax=Carnobacterium divergens TaxID=2748 RepID=A0AAW8R7D6_CARDV|nr:type VII secretion protein, YukD family [Carnobacterium divergens]MDT1957734.1 type VII secretion protein, YukD family [Carnobacterium divergens]MDT1973362.1 type VII secretion protein, YukD family [Carnobacterium divergens]TFJ44264.1 type VII secretion protein, YukD family [Carnobacterium divergens]TFJ52235.1 type VII secretion protein, YukD family [Carnobacterium divergens]TFJ57401.1 type VII secretion protein, YukD family [Carnobacterium divergens]